jgi:hypothetical protein
VAITAPRVGEATADPTRPGHQVVDAPTGLVRPGEPAGSSHDPRVDEAADVAGLSLPSAPEPMNPRTSDGAAAKSSASIKFTGRSSAWE